MPVLIVRPDYPRAYDQKLNQHLLAKQGVGVEAAPGHFPESSQHIAAFLTWLKTVAGRAGAPANLGFGDPASIILSGDSAGAQIVLSAAIRTQLPFQATVLRVPVVCHPDQHAHYADQHPGALQGTYSATPHELHAPDVSLYHSMWGAQPFYHSPLTLQSAT